MKLLLLLLGISFLAGVPLACCMLSDEKPLLTADQFSYDQIHQLMKAHSGRYPKSDQRKGLPMPPIEKPYPADAELIDLVPHEQIRLGDMSLLTAIDQRRSRRRFTDEYLSNEELSYLLWSTQGISKIFRRPDSSIAYHFRTVPSGGARHPFETYLAINRVEGLQPGIYRYLPIEHKLLFLKSVDNLPEKITDACQGQKFVGQAAAVFFWAAIPYRMEWRYNVTGYKDILIECGHVCQNLYLTAESIGAGACAIAAYHQERADQLIGVDGKDEFTVYASPVGKVDLSE